MPRDGGIGIVDNLQLALNLVSIPGGPIAFDEFHQGYGTNSNRFLQYFQGTPVIAIFLQCGLIVIAIFVSIQSFANENMRTWNTVSNAVQNSVASGTGG